MKRSELRENIFKLLFVDMFTDAEEMPQQLVLYFENMEMELSETDRAYMETKVNRILEKKEEIDALLNEVSSGWKTTRMSKVDLAIMRLAVYEIGYDESIPTRVAINEAVELSKKFGGDDSRSFINGVLGKAAQKLEQKED